MHTSIATAATMLLAASSQVEEVTVAVIGDQGLGADSEAVLQLIEDEGADMVLHVGDLDYDDNPPAWEAQINAVLGPEFPYFTCVGNHDDGDWYGGGGYQSFVEARHERIGVPWSGDLGVESWHEYLGVLVVFTAPDLFGDGDADYAPYVESVVQQEGADHQWRFSGFHVLQRNMQVGGKSDQAGWDLYEVARRQGMMPVNGHEHSYARTHALSSMVDQVVADDDFDYELVADDPRTPEDEGRTWQSYNGLGGSSIRDQERCFPATPPYGCNGEWAAMYTSDQNAQFGAIFFVLNSGGDPCAGEGYFKDIDGNVVDYWTFTSLVGPCAQPQSACHGDVDGNLRVDGFDLVRVFTAWGACSQPCPEDLDGDGTVGIVDMLQLLAEWGPCG